MKRLIARKGLNWFSDGRIHLFLAGTGTPLSGKSRAGSCAVVIAGKHFFMIDAGAGSWKNIVSEKLPVNKLSGILLTHYHSDHITDTGEAANQSWLQGRTEGSLPVYGPEGLEQVVEGCNRLYSLDRSYRTALHGEKALPGEAGLLAAKPFMWYGKTKSVVILEDKGLKITAFEVDHSPVKPACGYRLDYNHRSIVISGDTRKSENLLRYSWGTDLLIHEVAAKHLSERAADFLIAKGYQREGEMVQRLKDFHTTAREAAEIAQKSAVKKLVFTHIAPSFPPTVPQSVLKLLFFKGFNKMFKGPVIFGKDGMWFHV